MKNYKRKIIISLSKLFFISTSLFLISASFVHAQEKIDNFEVSIQINSDASIDVEEKIDYDFGSLERHGIFREIPIKYKARGGNYNLRISDIDVYDEKNRKYNFEVSYPGDYVKIKIGDADKYVSGEKTYIINYKIKRAINYFNSYDELYWNATGSEWQVPIEKSEATVYLPEKTESEELKAVCFSGVYGSQENCDYNSLEYADGPVEKILFKQNSLEPKEGLTVVVGFPKGLVSQPTKFQIFLDTLKDNWILFLPIAVFLILFYLWYTRGKDPEGRKTIIPQFDPPDNLTPAEVGTIVDEKADPKDISAEIINLAVKGYLKITRLEEKGIFKKTDYLLEKLKDESELKNDFEKKLMKGLFEEDKIKLSKLKNNFYKNFEEIRKGIYQSTVDKNYFPKSPEKVRWLYVGIGIATLFLIIFAGPIFGAIGAVSVLISAVMIIVFGFFMPVKTRKGVLAKEHILGLKEYLTVAEKDRIKFHNAPQKNPEHFEKLLPFAMVLGVEKEWAKQFEGIYNQQPSWYSDPSGRPFSAYALVGGLNSFQASAQSTLASHPSSAAGGASGFGGGGFSGGGFGGGGGGSW